MDSTAVGSVFVCKCDTLLVVLRSSGKTYDNVYTTAFALKFTCLNGSVKFPIFQFETHAVEFGSGVSETFYRHKMLLQTNEMSLQVKCYQKKTKSY